MLFYNVEIPPSNALLPDPIQPPYYQPRYTLVIEITDMLLHLERSLGKRKLGKLIYKKRPGLDYFINQIKYPIYEVVFFTREPFHSGVPIVASLDPHKSIQFKLFRESAQLKNNHYVKDLTCMNRDMSKIILLDWDKNAYQLQPRNALHGIKRWRGDEKDTDLFYLASFLRMLASTEVSDVREFLDIYNKESSPLESFIFSQIESSNDTETDESIESN